MTGTSHSFKRMHKELGRKNDPMCQSPWEFQQVTTSVQMSTQHVKDSLMEENPIQERLTGSLTLETIGHFCNSTCEKAALEFLQYLSCSV